MHDQDDVPSKIEIQETNANNSMVKEEADMLHYNDLSRKKGGLRKIGSTTQVKGKSLTIELAKLGSQEDLHSKVVFF